ncbi:MAG: bifunctional phosphopantothenoylcysteine decarboxylase/phosphopantothenate--cysteine ligase CoaBC [Thermoplasmata archaeon]|jgi:phosphopantothenoylcysteine decarboxylase/phosphopantothenate--cysteine ligase|nr:bifunctional phosphopantothenoylcysteine decarboxylase/phosphopantothenate--cysteine ligase CoaBC [Thermoplasmata archaeon]
MTHPSAEIYCEKSDELLGKTIVMGITGSIAAVECFAAIRELIRHGADVIPVMTEEALKLVTPDAMEFASGFKPITELTGLTEHITIMNGDDSADLLLIYPATANTISKIANGIDDNPVTSMAAVAMGNDIPILIAPAMHQAMYDNPAVIDNMKRLESWGVDFIGPRMDGGRAKVASVEEIVASVKRALSESPIAGKKVLIIGGRSEEPIDSMRLISNRSTGMMAVDLAVAAFERGAQTELWMGACSVTIPDYLNVRRFSSVEDLAEMTKDIDHDIVIVPAALSDFRMKNVREGKISSDSDLTLDLDPAPKILPMITSRCKTVLGFKAESGLTEQQLIDRARSRLLEYGLYAVVANDIDSAGKDEISVIMVREDFEDVITGSKKQIAGEILDQYFGGE